MRLNALRSRPFREMIAGMFSGLSLGLAAVFYLEIAAPFDQFCLLGISLMAGQLLGATIGGALGKPHL